METNQIVAIQLTDISAVAKYLASHTAGIYDEAYWLKILNWVWIDNPNINETHALFGYKIENSSGKICGMFGNIPVQYTIDGEIKRSSWPTSWYVDKNIRNRSLELFKMVAEQEGVLMNNTPLAFVETIIERMFDFRKADSLWFQRSFLFPLSVLRSYFGEDIKSPFSLRRMGILSIGTLLKIPQAFHFMLTKITRDNNEISVKSINDFSTATDKWFTAFTKYHPCSFVRSSKNYHWLFCNKQHAHRYKVIEVQYKNEVQGYYVFKKRRADNFSYIEMIDEAILPLPAKIQQKIIQKVYAEIYKQTDKESLLVMRSNSDAIQAAYKKLLGIAVNKIEKSYFRADFLPQGEQPFMTSLDGDSIFFQ